MQPRDPAEEMLVQQLVWVHARIGYLTAKANYQSGLKQLQVVTDALEKAHNTYRRLLLSLAEYRSPRPAKNFTAFKQVNVAEQQIVQNGGQPAAPVPPPAQIEKSANEKKTNEKGCGPEAPALPAVGGGLGLATGGHPAGEAVAEHAGTGDSGRKGAGEDERVEARSAERGGGG